MLRAECPKRGRTADSGRTYPPSMSRAGLSGVERTDVITNTTEDAGDFRPTAQHSIKSLVATHRDHRRHLVLAIGCKPHLVVGDVAGLDADHAAPSGIAKVGHRRALLGPRVPNHGRGGADLLEDDIAAPSVILDDAPRRRVQVNAVGLRRDRDN